MDHFDLSYEAFEALAHPAYGVMMLQYKPVDCDTKQDMPFGFVSSTVFSGGIGAGWGWREAKANYARLTDAQGATCLNVGPSGGISFIAKQARARVRVRALRVRA